MNSRRPAQRQGLSSAAQPWMKAPMRDPEHGDLSVTMRFDPEEGIADLEQHLDQLKKEAEANGFKFDHHAARNELQAATFGKRRPATARLLLSPTGAMAIEVRPEP
jgi:para-aminobenzoate synthetase/4-amino-4-deoxychorismate lyase